MRAHLLVALLALAGAGQAAAQSGSLTMMPAVPPAETSPIGRMTRESRAWIAEEQARQLAKPGDLVELALEIELAIGQDIMKIAERERIDTRDIIMAVMFDVMSGADRAIRIDVRRLQLARQRQTLTPAQDAELAEKVARQAEIQVRLAAVVRNQSLVSRALVASN